MDFTNEYYFFGAGAVIGLLIGALLMKAFYKRWGASWELKAQRAITANTLKLLEDQKKQGIADAVAIDHFKRDVQRLEAKIEELLNIDNTMRKKANNLEEIKKELLEKRAERFKLKNEIYELEGEKELKDYQAEEKEKQAKNNAERANKKDADDALDEYREASKKIGKDKLKQPKNDC